MNIFYFYAQIPACNFHQYLLYFVLLNKCQYTKMLNQMLDMINYKPAKRHHFTLSL